MLPCHPQLVGDGFESRPLRKKPQQKPGFFIYAFLWLYQTQMLSGPGINPGNQQLLFLSPPVLHQLPGHDYPVLLFNNDYFKLNKINSG